MNQNLLYAANGRGLRRESSAPASVQRGEQTLRDVRMAVEKFKRISDGYLFGFFGVDALLSFIPFVGGLYTASGGLWLLSQAVKAKASLRTKAKIAAIIAADVAIGAFPIVGDAADIFLRSHAWAADLILAEIDAKVTLENEHAPYWPAPPIRTGRRSGTSSGAGSE